MVRRDAGRLPDMWKETYDLVAQVPEGRVTTYGKVARALGDVVASRFVGLAMSRNDDIVRVPCRRVVQSDGFVGGYTGGGPERKAKLLEGEGIRVKDLRVEDLESVMFMDFDTSYPLRGLRRRQEALKKRLRLSSLRGPIKRVAGIDVAYDGERAYAAKVTLEYPSCAVVEKTIVRGEAEFPYIPTYLAFREGKIIEPLLEDSDDRTVIMYDGNGTLHPEGFGVACHIGVSSGLPVIGVAKKLLCGTVQDDESKLQARVKLNGRLVGYAVRSRAGAKPVFVSPGHMISPSQALAVTARMTKHRVPEPTRLAHIEAEAARRKRTNK